MQSATLGSLDLVRAFDQRYQVSRIQPGSLDLQYTRDAAGRVSTVVNQPIPATGNAMTATVSPDSNRLQTLNDGQVWNFVHDANGNVISEGGLSYTWDALNRLVQVRQGNTVLASYAYDLDSRLISEIQADGTPIRDYVYLNNEPLAVREYQKGPGLYFFLNDHLATPQKLINTAGAVVWAAAYLPYGEAQVQANSTITNNLRFPGQHYDEETDLHYNWNRYYDPVLGRYLDS